MNELKFPEQCIATGQTFIEVYGKDTALKIINDNIKSLLKAHQAMENQQCEKDMILNIAFQSDFWTQVRESIPKEKVLPRSFMEGLNPTKH